MQYRLNYEMVSVLTIFFCIIGASGAPETVLKGYMSLNKAISVPVTYLGGTVLNAVGVGINAPFGLKNHLIIDKASKICHNFLVFEISINVFFIFIRRLKMQARGPLMIEHRLIERFLSVIKGVLAKIESKQTIDPVFIDVAVDFIQVYADRTHHGKEEDILFRKLDHKPLTEEDRRVMNELIDEHVFGRQTTEALIAANNRYRNGDENSLAEIVAKLRILTEFYPEHIEKEDKVFFPSSRNYFSDEEDQAMLKEFYEFDRKMIHEKYESVVKKFESRL